MKNSEKFVTAKERAEAFREYALRNTGVNADNYLESAFHWLDLEAPAEEPLPCPFCGKNVTVQNTPYVSAYNGEQCQLPRWNCVCSCGMQSIVCNNRDGAVASHNRVARAVDVAKKENEI